MAIRRLAGLVVFASTVALTLVLTGTVAVAAQGAAAATAQVRMANGALAGTATFTPAAGGVQVSARLQGLTPGQHGIHVHTTGACDAPDFMTAGGHFNPAGKQHGLNNPAGPHVGDLPNLQVAANGTATFSGMLMGATLDGADTSLLKTGGTALVIHQDMDDEMTDPAGNSGARIACGVIVAGAQAGAAQVPASLPRTGDMPGIAGLLAVLGAGALAGGLALRRRSRPA